MKEKKLSNKKNLKGLVAVPALGVAVGGAIATYGYTKAQTMMDIANSISASGISTNTIAGFPKVIDFINSLNLGKVGAFAVAGCIAVSIAAQAVYKMSSKNKQKKTELQEWQDELYR